MWRKSPPCSIELVVVGLLAAGPAWAAAPGPEAAREKARAVLADPRYQRDLPRSWERTAEAEKAPAAQRDLDPGSGVDAREPERPALPDAAAAGFGLRVLGVLAAAALLLFLLRALLSWKHRGRSDAPPVVPATAAAEPVLQAVGAADRLAAEGRYAEAVHALLLQTLRDLAERFRVPLQPSRTSREILGLLPLKPDRREVLGDLVRMVERSVFGGIPLGMADYEKGLGLVRVLLGRGGAG